MNVQSQKNAWNRDALLKANFQLQTLYQQDGNPCLALMISRNYHLLLEQTHNLKEQQDWSDKAKIWQKLYRKSRINIKANVFYDESGLFTTVFN